jgi:hypothetical protein
MAVAFAAAWRSDSRDPRVPAAEAAVMLAATVAPALAAAAVITGLALGGLRDEARQRRAAHARWVRGRAAARIPRPASSPRGRTHRSMEMR